MKKQAFVAAGFVLAVFCAAPTTALCAEGKTTEKEMTAEQKQKEFLDYTGGFIQHRNGFQGRIAIVDAQGECPAKQLQALAKDLVSITEYNAQYVKGSAALAKLPPLEIGRAALKEADAKLAVVVVSQDNLPPSLIAIEDHWAVVNVKALKAGLPAGKLGEVMFAARCRKEAMRAYSVICGGSGSQYQGTIVNAIDPQDLDKLDETIPLDTILAYQKYLKRLGVTRSQLVTYRQAYVQGWAPAPTNDHQRACIEQAKGDREAYVARKAARDAEKAARQPAKK